MSMAGDEAGGGDGGRDDGRGQRVWHPVSMVPALTVVVDEQLAHSRTMLAKLEKARPTRPDAAVLDDATVSETRRVYGRMATDYRELFATQAQAWQAEAGLDVATRARVENFTARVDEHLVVLDAILALMDEVAPYTIEAVMGRSDLELGLEALLGYRPGPHQR